MGLEAHPTLVWPYHDFITSSMTLFPYKVPFWGTGVRTATYVGGLGECTVIWPMTSIYHFPLWGSMFWRIVFTKQNTFSVYSFSGSLKIHRGPPHQLLVPNEDGIESLFPAFPLQIQLHTLGIIQQTTRKGLWKVGRGR